jgi:hypothetical protein
MSRTAAEAQLLLKVVAAYKCFSAAQAADRQVSERQDRNILDSASAGSAGHAAPYGSWGR